MTESSSSLVGRTRELTEVMDAVQEDLVEHRALRIDLIRQLAQTARDMLSSTDVYEFGRSLKAITDITANLNVPVYTTLMDEHRDAEAGIQHIMIETQLVPAAKRVRRDHLAWLIEEAERRAD
jgi:hypothetical protein